MHNSTKLTNNWSWRLNFSKNKELKAIDFMRLIFKNSKECLMKRLLNLMLLLLSAVISAKNSKSMLSDSRKRRTDLRIFWTEPNTNLKKSYKSQKKNKLMISSLRLKFSRETMLNKLLCWMMKLTNSSNWTILKLNSLNLNCCKTKIWEKDMRRKSNSLVLRMMNLEPECWNLKKLTDLRLRTSKSNTVIIMFKVQLT